LIWIISAKVRAVILVTDVLRGGGAQKYAVFTRETYFAGFLEATGIFLMQTGSIETMRKQWRGVRLFTPSRPLR
jgi:hypothetical protein